MNISAPNNCNSMQVANPVFTMARHDFTTRIFSYFDFDKVIKDTLDDDVVIQNVRQTSPYFGGSTFSFDNIISQNLYYQYLRAYLDTRALYKRQESIRFHYLVDCALRVLVNDSLATDPFTGEIFKIGVKDTHAYSNRAKYLIDQFMDHFQIDRLIEQVAADAIFYGEYAMTLQTNKGTDRGEFQGERGVGITKIIDANRPGTIFGVWEAAHPKYYIRLKKGPDMMIQGLPERLEPTSVWSINIFPQTLPLSLGNRFMYFDDTNRIGSYIKVGQPLFHSVYPKIVELEAFEQAQYQKEFGDLRRRGLIGIQASSGLSLEQQREFCRFYEALLNENRGPMNLNDVQGLEQIAAQMATLSLARVVPQQPDRGKMDVIDLKIAADNVSEKINDRRKIALESLGIPFSAVFEAQEGGRQLNIRQYVQYMRRIKMIQNGIAWSLKRLLKTHLIMQGIPISQKEIEVHFYRSVNVSELDSMQALDTNVQYLKNFDELIMQRIQDPATSKYVDVSEVMRFYSKVFSQMEGIGSIIRVPEKEQIMGDQVMSQIPQEGDPGAQQVPAELQDMSNQIQNYPSADLPTNFQDKGWTVGWPKGVSSRVAGMPSNVKMTGGQLPGNVKVCSE